MPTPFVDFISQILHGGPNDVIGDLKKGKLVIWFCWLSRNNSASFRVHRGIFRFPNVINEFVRGASFSWNARNDATDHTTWCDGKTRYFVKFLSTVGIEIKHSIWKSVNRSQLTCVLKKRS